MAKLAWFRRQHALIKDCAARNNAALKLFANWTTNRQRRFSATNDFRRAVESAVRSNGSLILGDIAELLRRTSFDQIVLCIDELSRTGVPTLDAASGRLFSSFDSVELSEMTRQAGRERKARSQAVKDGLALAGKPKKAPPRSNGIRGGNAYKLKADRSALRLADFVRGEMAKLPPGADMSPSALAKALNAAGIPATRSSTWGHNSARNLLRRLTALGRL